MGRIAGWLLSLSVAMACAPAWAVDYEPMTFDGVRVLVVQGEFRSTDSISEFLSAVESHRAVLVTFDSPGGNLGSAMRHGLAVRALGLNTLQQRQSECASACALAFLGGVERWAEPGSIGVHRSHFGEDAPFDLDEAVDAMQRTTADVMAYLREMGVGPEFLEISLQYDRHDMRYLSMSEMRRMGVVTMSLRGDDAPAGGGLFDDLVPEAVTEPPTRTDPGPSARDFVLRTIAAHQKNPAAALAEVRSSYSDPVNYFGTTTSLGDILSDKRDYFERWPERFYQVRSEGLSVACGVLTCVVSGHYDWAVRSQSRNRQAAGRASFEFRVEVSGQEMRIVGEDSIVVERFPTQ